MRLPRLNKVYWIILIIALGAAGFAFMTAGHSVDYNTEIKPIFNKKCITCHGGVKRQSGFSLLFRSDALAINKSGKPAIIPGDPSHSEMIRRLTLKDPEERMPYKHPPLTDDEIATLKKWIKQGAKWGDHWAYVPVQATAIPKVDNWLLGTTGGGSWVKNDVDHFVYQKMREEGLKPSMEADRSTLLRRVSLDITGLPASTALADHFLKDNRSDAYEKLVDTLLSSPHYGERWAAMWMDLARYADTKGYERDDWRSIWRYRDWLIHAFNENKPYNEFLTEQLAGDLLPNPTDAQYIATAFHRNTMTNDEGGTDNEEFRTAAVIDRVNTTWETVMGTTFACVQCHSHPYDPFKHEEYYKFMAFFNNTRDEDTYDDYPLLKEFHKEDSVKFIQLKDWLHQNTSDREKELTKFVKTGQPAINSIAADHLINSALTDTKWLVLRNNGSARIPNVDFANHSQLLYRYKSWKPGGKWVIHLDKPDGAIVTTVNVEDSKGGWKITSLPLTIMQGPHDLYFTYQNKNLATPEETGMQFDWFFITDPFPGKGLKGYDSANKYFNDLLVSKQVTITPVMIENPKELFRSTHVFERGNWLVKGKTVEADVPGSLGKLPANAPRNRMGLAMWVTDKKNPLTARTIVNRIWEQFFGQGIAETLEDLGTQGIQPTHKELLDHLAYKLMNEYNWNLKKLMKEIVMSATYRQDTKMSKEGLEKDPFNKYYARGPRVRLSAEQIRDQALTVSGLLCEKMYGPGVFPYQPEGIWMSPWNGASWKKSDSCDQYRRAMYTYWKRSAPYPSMITFDGTSREVCTARRIRTNTPLQSLTTLNDSAYIEMAQFFAYRMQALGGEDLKKQISKGYELALFKPITPEKEMIFEKLYMNAYKRFRSDEEKMKLMAGNNKEKQTPTTAALVVVAGAMMNMDEFITKN
jgi:mono/diheme cytochrome c family protein